MFLPPEQHIVGSFTRYGITMGRDVALNQQMNRMQTFKIDCAIRKRPLHCYYQIEAVLLNKMNKKKRRLLLLVIKSEIPPGRRLICRVLPLQ